MGVDKEALLQEYVDKHLNETCNCDVDNMELCLGGLYLNGNLTKEEIFEDWEEPDTLSTYDKICLIVSNELDLLDKPLSEEMTLEELGADSLDAVEISLTIEDDFDITVEEEEFYNEFSDDATLKSITEFVERKLKGGQA